MPDGGSGNPRALEVSSKLDKVQERADGVDKASWTLYGNERFGFTAVIPGGFEEQPAPANGDGAVFINGKTDMTITASGINNINSLDATQYLETLWNGSSDSACSVQSNYLVLYQHDKELEYLILAYVGKGSINSMTVSWPMEEDNADELELASAVLKSFTPGDISTAH